MSTSILRSVVLPLVLTTAVGFAVGCSDRSRRSRSGSTASPTTQQGCPSDVDGDGPTNATALSNVPYSSSIDCAGDQDTFVVFLNPGTVMIAARGASDTLLTLFGPDGTTVLAQEDGPSAEISAYTVTASGDYYISVAAGSAAPQGTPRYTLEIQ
jgi:hypothetical protein